MTNDKSAYVSCQVLGQVFVHFDDNGIDSDAILADIPYSREHIENPSNFIDWPSLVVLFDRASEYFTDDEILNFAAQSYDQPLFIVYKLIGQLRYDVRGVYDYVFGDGSLLTKFYPMRCEVIEDDPLSRHVTYRLRVLEGMLPCKTFFMVLEGQARGISEIMGYGPVDVVATYLPDGIELSVFLPKESGIVGFFRRVITAPLNLIRVSRILQRTQDALVDRNRQLTADKEQLLSFQTQLERHQEQLNLLADNTPILLWTVDLDFKILYMSSSVESLLGYSPEDAISVDVRIAMDESSQETVTALLARELKKERKGQRVLNSQALRLRLKRTDGSIVWTENYVSFTRDQNGSPIGIVGVSIDIDNKVRQEISHAKLEDELNHTKRQELIGKVAGGIAHDFNNSLQSIIGFAELTSLTLKGSDREEAAKYQKLIVQSAASASELVQQLLAFSRQQTLSMQVIDVRLWIEDNIPMLTSMLGESFSLHANLANDLVVIADPVELERVLINLVLNAKEAMEPRGRLDITLAKADSPENFLCLTFTDSGVGVDENELHEIFDLYYSTKDQELSSGLGLAVSAGIIEQHGGRISARRNENKPGLSVDILLPLSDQKFEPDVHQPYEMAHLIGKQVLVVDDQVGITELVSAILKGEGASTTIGHDGTEAVAAVKAAESAFDLILMDVVMPQMNGDVAARRIQEIAPDTPVIFLTGYAGDRAIIDALAEETVLAKPFTRDSLLKTISEKLS